MTNPHPPTLMLACALLGYIAGITVAYAITEIARP